MRRVVTAEIYVMDEMSGIFSGRRGSHDILVDILKVAKNGAKKTNIIYKAMLSFDQAKRYLLAMKKAGFIIEESGVWKTSEKGLHVLEACKLCYELFEKTSKQRV